MISAPSRYHPLAVTLHWLLAVILIIALVMGSQVLEKFLILILKKSTPYVVI